MWRGIPVESTPLLLSAQRTPSRGRKFNMHAPAKGYRFSYGEQRFVTLGLLAGIPVSVVHTESDHEIRVISFRTATKREAQIYFHAIQN